MDEDNKSKNTRVQILEWRLDGLWAMLEGADLAPHGDQLRNMLNSIEIIYNLLERQDEL